MDLPSFVATVIFLTASGALAPGPLFFANISRGTEHGVKSGLAFSIAHTIVEFSLVLLLAFGLLTVAVEPAARLSVSVVGGIVLLIFGANQIRGALTSKVGKPESKVSSTNLLLVGLAFTGLNPFFIVWWLSVGANLIIISLEFASLPGVVLMYVSHVWMDYVWLVSIAYFAEKGKRVAGTRWYRILLIVFGLVLIYFGLVFLTGVPYS